MPSIRVIAGAAIGSLFVCGLFSGQGVAQTATESVDKLMQLLQPMNPGKSEIKPSGRSAAKHSSSKAPSAEKKRASTEPAAKESTLHGAAQVTVPPSELVIDGQAVRVVSPRPSKYTSKAINNIFADSEQGIYMGESDNQQTMYLFASRTDAARFWPWVGDQPSNKPGRRSAKGRKPTFDWEAALCEAAKFIHEERPDTDEEVKARVAEWFGDDGPSPSEITRHIGRPCRALRVSDKKL